jgi:hypothetical protein
MARKWKAFANLAYPYLFGAVDKIGTLFHNYGGDRPN